MRMAGEELKKACAALRSAGMDFAILCSHANVVYVSGFDEPVAVGGHVDAADGLPLSLAFLNTREEGGVLLVTEGYAEQARQNRLGAVATFGAFNAVSPADPARLFRDGARAALRGIGMRGETHARIGVELEILPAVLSQLLAEERGSAEVAGCRQHMEGARAVKTAREIGLIRNAARAADAGQRALVEAARTFAGGTELDVWGVMSARVGEAVAATCPVPLIGELVTGPRTGVVRYPGGPQPRRIARGDTGIMDISVRVDGYWSDCCNTVVFGGAPTADQRRYYNAARDGFDAAAAALRPGVRCSDVHAAVRDAFARHGFPEAPYCGHQIGAAVNEIPRIVAFETAVVEAGMVFCLEPGVYAGPDGATGARLERMVLVTDGGAELLNRFPWGFDAG
jgi:Xaa-Pro aminopeptidase